MLVKPKKKFAWASFHVVAGVDNLKLRGRMKVCCLRLTSWEVRFQRGVRSWMDLVS
jgi:hypothetical protein